jgi:hypothetical protein
MRYLDGYLPQTCRYDHEVMSVAPAKNSKGKLNDFGHDRLRQLKNTGD